MEMNIFHYLKKIKKYFHVEANEKYQIAHEILAAC